MKILALGGTGNISFQFVSACLAMGLSVTSICRGSSHSGRRRMDNLNKKDLFIDLCDINALDVNLADKYFDVVVDFICYDRETAIKRINYFKERTSQYIYISTTASYSKNPKFLPYNEKTPLDNTSWDYCLGKVQAEHAFNDARDCFNFPVTIVRLAHTYDIVIPVSVGPADWTVPKRILDGKPIPIHGDGTGIWTLTHSVDVANALVGLCFSSDSIGETIHVTSDVKLTWMEITKKLFDLLKMPVKICYVPSRVINQTNQYFGNGIIGHKMWCDFYDNSKIKKLLNNWQAKVNLEDGLLKSITWYQENPARQHVSSEHNSLLSELCIKSEFVFEGY